LYTRSATAVNAVWKGRKTFWDYLKGAYEAVNKDAAKMTLGKPSNKPPPYLSSTGAITGTVLPDF
jgi:hypothetical protein